MHTHAAMELLDDLEQFGTLVVPRALWVPGLGRTLGVMSTVVAGLTWYGTRTGSSSAHVAAGALAAVLTLSLVAPIWRQRHAPPALVVADRDGLELAGRHHLPWQLIDHFAVWRDRTYTVQPGVQLTAGATAQLHAGSPGLAARIAHTTGTDGLIPLAPGLPSRYDPADVVTILNVARQRLHSVQERP